MTDVTIIGGGPAGLFASFYSGLRGMSVRIIDFQNKLGGKMHVYPEKVIWDIGALAPKPCYEVIQDLVQQGLHFGPEVCLEEKVIDIKKVEEQHFIIHTEKGHEYHSKSVIIAVGGGIIKPLTLDIEGAERFELSNLNYVVQSIQKFKDKHILISGAGNSALDWACDLSEYAKSVTLCYRKEEISGHEHMKQLLDKLDISKKSSMVIKQLNSDPNKPVITEVVLEHVDTNEQEIVPVDEVIISHGFDRESELLHNAQTKVNLVNDFFIEGLGNSQTSVPGIFGAGDILKHDAKVHLIASCFNDAANAANLAKSYIDPEAQAGGRVSSHNDIFKEKNKEVIKKYIAQS
ncbi:thioredoxin reductase [Mammaliicoccus sciuri]|uniref:NAD(P)/FAD-dependent oxidoreductase n=1 Tax=Mammaliicoccus sciuri TaxID=1296 RepID=UPI000733F086|nr:NAD(P)/FAD-dependent oxidoreductase [Mammaliicoccus sciuri]KTT85569.1 thioredoxin reductase [Mammaliicoccus sciuri]KTT86398.1 thioredoxin reductase [Mammaliicoccus sciuri]KTT89155.1 thioredoxin reductase [Mammaliicoccus sciuri]KTT94211.1 thioredoxin reductase [Mammaliicoccus sciuri]KTW13991.1 thioredoxin reductase [Mammaliicoccus sciuri]